MIIQPLSKRRRLTLAALAFLLLGIATYFAGDWYLGSRRMVATITPYNYTDIGVSSFFVDGTWGGISEKQSGGGRSMCCVSIPERWHEHFSVTVKWKKDAIDGWLTQTVSVPPYTESGALQVIFLKNDQVKVLVYDRSPLAKDHPLHKELYEDPNEKRPQKPFGEQP